MSGSASAVLGSSSSSSYPQFPTQREIFSVNLPVDVLVVIFGKLTPREVARLSAVCRSFSEAAKSDQLWRDWLPPNIQSVAENAYRGPIRYDSMKSLYDRFRTSNYHILLGDGQEGCGIEPDTGGYFCTFAARKLGIAWGSDPRYCQWIPGSHVPGARFTEVANLEEVCWLHVSGEFTVRLPPGTYSFRWVLKFHEERYYDNNRFERNSFGSERWSDPVTFTFTDGGMVQSSEVMFPPVREDSRHGRRNAERSNRVQWKPSGWVEYVAGVFTVDEFDDEATREITREVHLKSEMKETVRLYWKRGLIVDGVVIRQQDDSISEQSDEIDDVRNLHFEALSLEDIPNNGYLAWLPRDVIDEDDSEIESDVSASAEEDQEEDDFELDHIVYRL